LGVNGLKSLEAVPEVITTVFVGFHVHCSLDETVRNVEEIMNLISIPEADESLELMDREMMYFDHFESCGSVDEVGEQEH
jgi:hypothetical protein